MQASLTKNILKFQPLLVGGVFVHVPFLLAAQLEPADRISQFRSTEILMLRCGSAFADCIMLGRNLAELEGHTKRVGDLVEQLGEMARSERVRKRGEGSSPGSAGGSAAAAGCEDASPPLLNLEHLTVFAGQSAAEERMLIEDLSLAIRRGGHTMVSRST
jgi:hypothetical protein